MSPVKSNQGVEVNTTDVADITIELRDISNLSVVATSTAILKTNGTAVCTFPAQFNGSYYIAVNHRNMIQTWSASPINFGSSPITYDFTNLPSKAFGNNMIQIEPGVWAFYSGDMNQDGLIDLTDYSVWESDYLNFAFGDYMTDLNGDGLVDLTDYSLWENNYLSFIFSATP